MTFLRETEADAGGFFMLGLITALLLTVTVHAELTLTNYTAVHPL